MAAMNNDKYCLETDRSNDHTHLTRNSKELMVSVDLAEEKKPGIHIYLTKNGNKNAYGFPPKTDEYTIVKPSSKEEFYKAYNIFLRNIHQLDMSSEEFYLMKRHDKPPNGMAWYSTDQHNKMGMQVEFYNDKKDFSLRINHIKSWQGIQHLRRAGNLISEEKFNLFFKAIFNFVHDFENYNANFNALIVHDVVIGSSSILVEA